MSTEVRPIRTFHPRRGRIGTTSADALARLWDTRGVDVTEHTRLRPEVLFGRSAPLVLEIGSGMGDATIALATADPERDYLAVDVHTPGLGNLLARADEAGLSNVRAARGDGLELLAYGIAPGSLDAINVFFPDPWPKARHHKRRMISPDRVDLMRDRLRVGGLLHVATDWAHYAEQILEVLSADAGLVNRYDGFAPDRAGRPETKYERRGVAAGRTIFDCVFARRG